MAVPESCRAMQQIRSVFGSHQTPDVEALIVKSHGRIAVKHFQWPSIVSVR